MKDRNIFLAIAGLLLILSLGFVWQSRIPPMQDYPQHLMQFHVLSTWQDPRYDWQQYFDNNLRLAPYSAEYWLALAFSQFLEIEASGKAVLSVYFILLGVFVWSIAQVRKDSAPPPWGVLTIFPLAFNQFYFLGFVNYLLSLPVLLLALFHLQHRVELPWKLSGWGLHSALLATLFLCHNYSAQVYVVLAFALALTTRINCGQFLWRLLLPPAALAIALAVWTSMNYSDVSAGKNLFVFQWVPPSAFLQELILPFTGMQRPLRADLWTVFPWLIVAAVLFRQFRYNRNDLWLMLAVVLCFLGFFALPSWVGHYSYFNRRMAAIIYLLLAWIFALVALNRKSGLWIAAACFCVLLRAGTIQKNVSTEKEEILPILTAMEPNSLIVPLIENGASTVLNHDIFYQLHHHDFFYYHVIVGGGANPAMFDNLLMAVRYRIDVTWPSFPVQLDDWPKEEYPYRYVVARGLTDNQRSILTHYASLKIESGRWALFERNYN